MIELYLSLGLLSVIVLLGLFSFNRRKNLVKSEFKHQVRLEVKSIMDKAKILEREEPIVEEELDEDTDEDDFDLSSYSTPIYYRSNTQSILIGFGMICVIFAVGVLTISNIQSSLSEHSTQYNITQNILLGMEKMSSFFPLIAIVLFCSIIIGIVRGLS